ncbi:MAG: nucleotidyltransferase domain-containing protein [Lentisphaeria bacterium]|nr:nucleotidyltransferase domain-containing protein [Lentisphaeria bacterium]
MVSMKEIEDVGRQIGDRFNPERIILFGSYVDGEPTDDSDVDLLVVMPTDGSSVDQSVEIRLSVHPLFPMDLLVRTPKKVRERLDMGDPFIRRIMEEGRCLYEAH